MPGPHSNQRLPRRVDPRKFAHQGVELEGQIAESGLPRLSQAVSRIVAPAQVKLRFEIDESGFRTVTGPAQVTVSAVCQRCMAETQLQINSQLAVGVVTSDEKAKLLPRSLEPWLIDNEASEADLYAVVEDELLLDLPMVVYHDYQCIDEELYSAGDASIAEALGKDKPNLNPFRVLEQLKGGKKKH